MQPETDASAPTENILATLARYHVVKINDAFPVKELLSELRDAIEICDFFVTNFKPDKSLVSHLKWTKDQQNKALAFKRFEGVDTTRKLPAFPLGQVPLANFAVQQIIKSSPALKSIFEARQKQSGSELHSCWARPSNNVWADRRTEWLWHQDKPFHHGDDLSVWIPLTECGEHAPSVEFFVSENAPSEVLPMDPKTKWSVDPDTVRQLEGSHKRFTPKFQPGDCIVFDGYAVHRTHALPRMSRERTSIDIRISPAL